MRVLRVVVDADVHGVGCDLTWRSRTVAVEEDRFRRLDGTRTVMDYTRLTQFGTWEGWVRTGDTEITVDPGAFLGSRDRSWGIRGVGEPEGGAPGTALPQFFWRSDEHTSELQSLMRSSYAVLSLKKINYKQKSINTIPTHTLK